ncbi:sphinganine-1-phosphate aldolase DPL1 [Sugiyamaella lignohabitans]|uniref:sphinganine-1-phosphate aldolase n=1 Tax=Sugiyamaella lignohabitans TaxID=796027 RepID=A0A161HH66_9ASCO|nr:sphinganine-1-phosphate aldolase DPL1 [Sugiyamaella lignohabitans]ANB15260.1 sphinganine-1-phosphate aldolase DPL1 [Sugiyamaella lignohabitans]
MRKFLDLPGIRGKVQGELNKALEGLDKKMIDRSQGFYTELPEQGWSEKEVLAELDKNNEMKHTDWEHGRVSGAVYHGGKDMTDMQTEAYRKYSIANQLHPDVFPGVRKMESEVVSMVLKLYNAPKGACGTSTSGGTESLLLTCLAARELAYRERGVTEPEILAPVTIHAGFDKAAYYFKMKLVHAPLDPVTLKVDLKAVRKLVNKNTVLIAGSAPNFPHGIIDDIEGLSKIALRWKIPLHVDACLGSFIVPFLERAGFKDIPLFDFRVPGVTSISCDTHKYGFAPKGSSIILYRTEKLRSHQYFVSSDWSGGLYASPTLAGSRPGALMVGCWASLMRIGIDGYTKACKDIVGAARAIRAFIENEIPELYIMGDPLGSVVAFSSTKINIYDLADTMSAKGWHLNALQNPQALHIACTRLTPPVVDELTRDLKDSVAELVSGGSTKASDGTAALYGVAGSISTVGVAERIATGFLDNLYKV